MNIGDEMKEAIIARSNVGDDWDAKEIEKDQRASTFMPLDELIEFQDTLYPVTIKLNNPSKTVSVPPNVLFDETFIESWKKDAFGNLSFSLPASSELKNLAKDIKAAKKELIDKHRLMCAAGSSTYYVPGEYIDEVAEGLRVISEQWQKQLLKTVTPEFYSEMEAEFRDSVVEELKLFHDLHRSHMSESIDTDEMASIVMVKFPTRDSIIEKNVIEYYISPDPSFTPPPPSLRPGGEGMRSYVKSQRDLLISHIELVLDLYQRTEATVAIALVSELHNSWVESGSVSAELPVVFSSGAIKDLILRYNQSDPGLTFDSIDLSTAKYANIIDDMYGKKGYISSFRNYQNELISLLDKLQLCAVRVEKHAEINGILNDDGSVNDKRLDSLIDNISNAHECCRYLMLHVNNWVEDYESEGEDEGYDVELPEIPPSLYDYKDLED